MVIIKCNKYRLDFLIHNFNKYFFLYKDNLINIRVTFYFVPILDFV